MLKCLTGVNMPKKETIEVLVEGGKASPAPPLGPKLAEMKMNIGEVVAAINEKTKSFSGMQVPVKVIINEDKSYSIEVGTPPVSALIKKELNIQKLAKTPGSEVVGNLTFDQIIKIANSKGFSGKSGVKQIIGSCLSAGVTVENKNPKEIMKEIEEGKWDEKI